MNENYIQIKKLPAARIWATGIIMLMVASLMISLVFTLVLQKIPGNIRYVPAGIVFVIVIGSFYNFIRAVREQILLDKTTLSYKRGFKSTTIALTDIREVELVENVSSGFSVKNSIKRMIANALMGKFQLQISLTDGTSFFIPRVAGGGNLISPNLGFTEKNAQEAKEQIEDYINRKPTNEDTQSIAKEK
jgi:hypothetical protein|tara:strand:+ start:4465 stop:5034 length:570 start_codon:yes stop_codon:yes gene_type:complete